MGTLEEHKSIESIHQTVGISFPRSFLSTYTFSFIKRIKEISLTLSDVFGKKKFRNNIFI